MKNRQTTVLDLFPEQPKYRHNQITTQLFQPENKSWEDFTNLPIEMRTELQEKVPFFTVKEALVQVSQRKDTYKAKLEVVNHDNPDQPAFIESVLMLNPREQWTICVSSQIGCAMACSFCATGKMGLSRNLTDDEIIDQFRFWQHFLKKNPEIPQRISNIVFMGMGEPLANYIGVRSAINTILDHSDLGHTKITVSTVGVIPSLKRMLTDEKWPDVRIALSLHSADKNTRENIVPTSFKTFLPDIREWAREYLSKYGNRKHHLTFEYVMLKNVNDTREHAKKLANFVKSIGNVKVNLIPYNFIGMEFQSTTPTHMTKFKDYLMNEGVTTTIRKTMGEDIDAACGQLITKSK
jgi:23S rRNA (adenine2503-C2)-methyltransferase